MLSSHQIIQFFQKDKFSSSDFFFYFAHKLKEPGTLDFLISRLQHINKQEIQFYLPQLTYLVVMQTLPKLELFLFSYGSQRIENFFSVLWLIQAYSQKNKKEYFEYFERNLESQLVNSVIEYEEIQKIQTQMREHDFKALLLRKFIEKEHRSNYVTIVNRFVQNLIKISLSLKEVPQDKQFLQLKTYMQLANQNLRKLRKNFPEVQYFQGIVLPFHQNQREKFNSNMIVRIIDNDFTCYNTKMRVPYRIIIETIDPKDLLFSRISSNENETDAEVDFIDLKIYNDDVEKILSEIAQSKILFDYDINELKKFISLGYFSKNTHLEIPQQSSFTRNKQTQVISIFDRLRKQHPTSMRRKSVELSGTRLNCSHNSNSRRNSLREISTQEKIGLPGLFGPWEEIWQEKAQLIQSQSPYRNFQSYKLRQVIIKGGDDLRQESLAMQMISKIHSIFKREKVNLYLRPYEMIVTSHSSGIIEYIPDTLSIDALKKKVEWYTNLYEFYEVIFGKDFEEAQKNFIESLAGYSLVCYVLNIKDRHNGHIIHIDFGFIFTLTPGNIEFEQAPFKLTNEYIQLMGGPFSDLFWYFKSLLFQGNYVEQLVGQRFSGVEKIC